MRRVTEEQATALLAGATSGPWDWRAHQKRDGKPQAPYLCSNTGPRYTVLDSVRQGMQGTQLRFGIRTVKPSRMVPVSELGDGWREHGDAKLIAASPDVTGTLVAVYAENRTLREQLGALATKWSAYDIEPNHRSAEAVVAYDKAARQLRELLERHDRQAGA